MALTRLATAVEQWWLTWRPGPTDGAALGYTALVSDLAVGDFLVGPRMTVTALGTSGTTRSITATRLDITYTFTLVSASTVIILRPT